MTLPAIALVLGAISLALGVLLGSPISVALGVLALAFCGVPEYLS